MNYIYGIHTVLEAVNSGKIIEKVYYKRGLKSENLGNLLRKLRANYVSIQEVPEEKLNYMTKGNHQGMIAVCSEIEYQEIEPIIQLLFDSGKNPFIVLLDHITDVRNAGAIARTCECAGVDALVVPSQGAAMFNADAIKSSSGALNIIPVCRVKSLINTIKYLKDCGLSIVCATEKSSEIIFDIAMPESVALVLGSEDRGISGDILKISDLNVQIPIFGQIESLNVSAAAAICIYEIVKQRKKHFEV